MAVDDAASSAEPGPTRAPADRRRRRTNRYLRTGLIGAAVLLPALSLIPLGSLWLWQNGYLMPWVFAALAISGSSYLFELWLIRPHGAAVEAALHSPVNPSLAPREVEAWQAVNALAVSTDPSSLTSRDAIVDAGLRTVEAVARRMYPAEKDPLWNFTVPEALALVERVSRDLRPFVVDNIPLGDRLTVAQVMRIYRWRTVIDVAEKAYDLWRIVRLVNPVAAVTNEARERLTKKLYSGVRAELATRLTRGYITEVGRAAIELYSGRLRVMNEQRQAGGHDDGAAAAAGDPATPESNKQRRGPTGWRLGKVWSQAINAGRVMARALRKS